MGIVERYGVKFVTFQLQGDAKYGGGHMLSVELYVYLHGLRISFIQSFWRNICHVL